MLINLHISVFVRLNSFLDSKLDSQLFKTGLSDFHHEPQEYLNKIHKFIAISAKFDLEAYIFERFNGIRNIWEDSFIADLFCYLLN